MKKETNRYKQLNAQKNAIVMQMKTLRKELLPIVAEIVKLQKKMGIGKKWGVSNFNNNQGASDNNHAQL